MDNEQVDIKMGDFTIRMDKKDADEMLAKEEKIPEDLTVTPAPKPPSDDTIREMLDILHPKKNDISGLLTIEDSSKFQIDRFHCRHREMNVANKLLDIYKVSSELSAKGVVYVPTLMLYGQPGTGKTHLARYIAYKAELPFVLVRFSNLVTALLGSTQQNVAKVFDYARKNPCVLCFDEIDAIGLVRGVEDVGEMSRIVVALMQEIDSLQNGTILVATTNRFDLLDTALVRRFALRHQVQPLSNQEIGSVASCFFDAVGVDTAGWLYGFIEDNFESSETASTVIDKCKEKLVELLIRERLDRDGGEEVNTSDVCP